MERNQQPIGVFDSGVGGLTAAIELAARGMVERPAALMLQEAGRVVQSGPASALLAQPDNALPLAEGSGIVVRATVCGHDAARGLTTVAFEQGQLQLPDTVARQPGEAAADRIAPPPEALAELLARPRIGVERHSGGILDEGRRAVEHAQGEMGGVVGEVSRYLSERAQACESAGIARDRIRTGGIRARTRPRRSRHPVCQW